MKQITRDNLSEFPGVDITYFNKVYRTCSKGSGYYCYHVISLTDLGNSTFLGLIRGTHWKSKASLLFKFKIENNKRIIFQKYMFNTPLEYFLYILKSTLLMHKKIKTKPQFKHELQDIQHKYPEGFL